MGDTHALKNDKKKSKYTKHKGKAVLAGGLSGAFEICCTYPTEFVKTTQQLSPQKLDIKDIVKSTMKEKGFGGFYRGLSSMLYFAPMTPPLMRPEADTACTAPVQGGVLNE